jgi:hypothetical protein
MSEIACHSEIPFEVVWGCSSSPEKIALNALILKLFLSPKQQSPEFHTMNPELFGEEIDDPDPGIVAGKKNENVIKGLSLEGERTVAMAWDTVTLYNGWINLSRLLRQIPEADPHRSAEEQWEHIDSVLKTERKIMKDRFTKRSFFIEWQVAFALLSADGSVQRTAVLVIKKMFEAISPARVNQVFKLNRKLKKMRKEGKVPTRKELAEGIQAFFFGPGMPLAEMPGAQGAELVVYNRDYPEDKHQLEAEILVRLIRDCALPPHLLLAFLTGQEMREAEVAEAAEGGTGDEKEIKSTFYLDLSEINDYGTILEEYATA